MKTQFSPVNPIFYDILYEEQQKEFGNLFYFGNETKVEEAKGKITGLTKKEAFEEYLVFDTGDKVRIDRIITVNGIPGPAYDEYYAFALAYLNCNVVAD